MRRVKLIATITLGVILAAGAWARIRFAPQADVGAAYMAKHMCSCVFVGGRDREACRLDMGREMEPVRWQVVQEGVRAWVPLLASRTASLHEGTGCTLD